MSRFDPIRRTLASPRRRLVAGLAAVAVLVIIFLLWPGRKDAAAAQQSAVAQIQPFAETVTVSGTIAPADKTDVVAPFDGSVSEVDFSYGGVVQAGQVLVRMDVSDLDQRLAQARAAWLGAAEQARQMADWSSGPEVSQARRSLAQARLDLDATRSQLATSRGLLAKGLVPRDETDQLARQARAQAMALQAARQDLAVTLARGRGAERAQAEIEAADDRAQLQEFEAERAGAVVRASTGGIMMRPPSAKGDDAGPARVGAQLARGQLIGSIARSGGLGVAFEVAEPDADRVRPGETVTVTGPGFGGYTARGVIISEAAEASPASAGGGPLATFQAIARLDPPPPGEVGRLRIGMTADVTVATYANPAALVIPPQALQGSAPLARVEVKDPRSGKVTARQVRVGHVGPDAVEILGGLKPGETVVWTPPAPSSSDDQS